MQCICTPRHFAYDTINVCICEYDCHYICRHCTLYVCGHCEYTLNICRHGAYDTVHYKSDGSSSHHRRTGALGCTTLQPNPQITCGCPYIHKCTLVHICIYVHAHIHLYIYVCMYTHAHTCTYIYTYTHTYTLNTVTTLCCNV